MNYIDILRFLESQKHTQRSRFKIIRGVNHYKYLIICMLENILIRHADISKCKLMDDDGVNIVCSLTSFPLRINECFYAIKSILLQSVKPNRIVLWLASSQFPDKKLPKSFEELIKIGVEIRYCEDLRSHKKYFYMLQEQKENELIITFDDDIIYHPDTISRALDMHEKYPNCIVCNDAKLIELRDDKQSLASYNKWQKVQDGTKEPDIYKYSIMTGSGCLYPYGVIPDAIFNEQQIRNLAFTADDLWITFTAKAFQVSVIPTTIVAKNYTTVSNSQRLHLAQINCLGVGNDNTINNMLNLYPQMKDNLIHILQ